MAKRGLSGQLYLFDFWGDTNPEDSIVEMVSLVPEEPEEREEPKVEMVSLMPEEEKDPEEAVVPEETIEPEEAKEPKVDPKEGAPETQAPVMHKEKTDKNGNVLSEISYLNYNKVFIRNSKYQQGKLFEFENSKDAVDFYITEMMKLTGEDSWDQE